MGSIGIPAKPIKFTASYTVLNTKKNEFGPAGGADKIDYKIDFRWQIGNYAKLQYFFATDLPNEGILKLKYWAEVYAVNQQTGYQEWLNFTPEFNNKAEYILQASYIHYGSYYSYYLSPDANGPIGWDPNTKKCRFTLYAVNEFIGGNEGQKIYTEFKLNVKRRTRKDGNGKSKKVHRTRPKHRH